MSERLCSVEGCNGVHEAKEFCKKHYASYKRSLQPKKPKKVKICSVEGCEDKHVGKGYCNKHYNQMYTYGRILTDEEVAELKKQKYANRKPSSRVYTDAISKEELTKLYIEDDLLDTEIAELKGVSKGTVGRLRKKYGIKTKPPKKLFTKEELVELYVNRGMTDEEIGKLKDVGYYIIGNLRKEYGIKTLNRVVPIEKRMVATREEMESLYLARKLSDAQISEMLGCSIHTVQLMRKHYGIETRQREYILTKEQLHHLYVVKGLSDAEIADQIGVVQSHVSIMRRKYGIETRGTIDAHAVPYVAKLLESKGYRVVNVRESDHASFYDLLVNDTVRVDVRATAYMQEDTLRFKFLDKDASDYTGSDTRLLVESGRTKRKLHETCDILVLVGYIENKPHCWVIPVKDLKPNLQGIGIRPYSVRSKYSIYEEAWKLIKVPKEILTKKELERLYITENLSDSRIAKRVGVSTATIGNLRRAYGIEAKRNIQEMTKEELEKLYIEDGLTDKEIAERKGTYPTKIRRLREKYGIETNSKATINKEELTRLYVEEGLSEEEIAKLKKAKVETVARLRQRYGIKARTLEDIITKEKLQHLYVEKRLPINVIADMFGVTRNTVTNIRKKYNIPENPPITILTNEELQHLYVEKGLSDGQIAKLKGIAREMVLFYRNKHGIQRRTVISDRALHDVGNYLVRLGFHVVNMREYDYQSMYDLLLQNRIRVDIKATEYMTKDGFFKFKLLDKDESNYKESDTRLRVDSGRTKRNLHDTCDYIICVGYLNGRPYTWIIPSRDLRKDLQGITVNPFAENSRYMRYAEAWHLVK